MPIDQTKKLPEFDENIPVSLNIDRPNRYGYTKISDINGLTAFQILKFDINGDSHYEISAAPYIPYVPQDINKFLYARLTIDGGRYFFCYLSNEFRELLLKGVANNESIKGKDCYICLENHKDNSSKDGIVCFGVIDLYQNHYDKLISTEDKSQTEEKMTNNNDEVVEYPEFETAEDEVTDLVKFFRPMEFTDSSQVSNYIRKYKLGRRYKHISGYLELENGCDRWEFNGGISPQYYAQVCRALNLDNKRTNSRVQSFVSYKERDFSN